MRFLRFAVLIIAILLWAGGLFGSVSHWLYETGVIADEYRYGDLYRLSSLAQFKQGQPVCPPANRTSDTASTHLYLIGDSFTEPERIKESDFRVSHYQRASWGHQQRIQLDPTKRNVLLIESVERHFRQHFEHPITEIAVVSDTGRTAVQPLSFFDEISHDFHRTDVEERLEATLFSHDWAFWFKELKAALTLKWFDRASPKVSLSQDKKQIFLNLDTDTTLKNVSSFSGLTDREVAILADSVNAVAAQYKRLGFSAVYLSIIPNKASILETHRSDYNHLIERLRANPRLAVPTIDVYDAFKHASPSPYLKGDTHWTCEGQRMWLERARQKMGI